MKTVEVAGKALDILYGEDVIAKRILELADEIVLPMEEIELVLPCSQWGTHDYTDFYASLEHATNVGSMFRPDNPLLPNYKHMPIAYHGRVSSLVASGQSVRRPVGQLLPGATIADGPPVLGACKLLDYELEVGLIVGRGNELGEAVAIGSAEEHILGLCLVNDWSARDMQKWEYQPLGPFLAKNFATSVSPFVVTLDALAPFRCAARARGGDDPKLLDYLVDDDNQKFGGFDITLEVHLASAQMRQQDIASIRLSRGNFKEMYWTIAQMLAHETPLRLMLGRVAMDRGAPTALIEEDLARADRAPAPSPTMPAFGTPGRHEVSANPRFAITCSEELLAEVGWHVREHAGMCIQTHLSETTAECARVAELFPEDASYAGVYDRFGLLTDRTLLAHCLHLTDDEWRLVAERRSTVVHCPTANTFLRAGLFDLGKARETGVRLALGTDIAAGADVAMPRVARAMIEVAKVRSMTVDPKAYIPSPAEAWGLITREGADALGWEKTGRIEPGADADLLMLRVPDTWHDEHLIGRLIYNWSPDLIGHRILNGTHWESP